MGRTGLSLVMAAVVTIWAAAQALAGGDGGYRQRYWVEETCTEQGLNCVARMRYAPGQGPSEAAGWKYWYAVPRHHQHDRRHQHWSWTPAHHWPVNRHHHWWW
ncbi:MAG: hypothetical protein HY245_07850 [Rhizobiales bacterium]|nr:hypothetical protein [Hyphomicrobiales bacterium]